MTQLKQLKQTNIPLTDTEIKQLVGFQKRIVKESQTLTRRSKFSKGSRNWDLYLNLLSRENTPPALYKLKTIPQIKKASSYALDAINYFGKPNFNMSRTHLIKYLDKTENIKPEDYTAFIKENQKKIQKIRNSKRFKDLVLEKLKTQISQDSLPKQISDWALKIIANEDINTIVNFDGYKLSSYLDISTKTESWVSYQGASMTTKKALVTFELFNKEQEFTLDVSGYWN